MDLPYAIEQHLSDVKHVRLFGKPITDYSTDELAAYIIWQNEGEIKRLKEKHRQFKFLHRFLQRDKSISETLLKKISRNRERL